MQVKDIMTKDPACCTEDTGLTDVARLMVDNNCGAIPVVASRDNPRPIGIITDRDIVCRTLANGKDPFEMAAGDCMSKSPATVTPETSLEDCANIMKQHQVRRIPVVDGSGKCCGMVAQADLALTASQPEAAQVVKEVSQPTDAARR